jgi:cytochrome c-type biogenesis protein CcmH/NrfG
VEVCGEDPAVHAARGDFLHNMERIEEAEASYQAALGLKPDHAGAIRGLGAVLWKGKGQVESADEMLKRSLNLNPTDPDTLMLLAEISVDMGRIEEAEVLYDQAHVAQVNHPELLLSHGRFLYEIKRDFTAAEHKLGYALHLRPNDTRVMMQVLSTRTCFDRCFDRCLDRWLCSGTFCLPPFYARSFLSLI